MGTCDLPMPALRASNDAVTAAWLRWERPFQKNRLVSWSAAVYVCAKHLRSGGLNPHRVRDWELIQQRADGLQQCRCKQVLVFCSQGR